MAIFEKWSWIKQNWHHIVEEAEQLGLVFVGGTALNLVLFGEYRASEDIDLYNPDSKGPDNPKGRSESDLLVDLSKRLFEKGFEVKKQKERYLLVGPAVKIDIFHDGTVYRKIEKRKIDGTSVLLFDLQSYADMKMAALLCRTNYDARDVVDLYVLNSKADTNWRFQNTSVRLSTNAFQFGSRRSQIQKKRISGRSRVSSRSTIFPSIDSMDSGGG